MYKILQAKTLINEKQLLEFRQQGWRLITIVTTPEGYFFYFEKVHGA